MDLFTDTVTSAGNRRRRFPPNCLRGIPQTIERHGAALVEMKCINVIKQTTSVWPFQDNCIMIKANINRLLRKNHVS